MIKVRIEFLLHNGCTSYVYKEYKTINRNKALAMGAMFAKRNKSFRYTVTILN